MFQCLTQRRYPPPFLPIGIDSCWPPRLPLLQSSRSHLSLSVSSLSAAPRGQAVCTAAAAPPETMFIMWLPSEINQKTLYLLLRAVVLVSYPDNLSDKWLGVLWPGIAKCPILIPRIKACSFFLFTHISKTITCTVAKLVRQMCSSRASNPWLRSSIPFRLSFFLNDTLDSFQISDFFNNKILWIALPGLRGGSWHWGNWTEVG